MPCKWSTTNKKDINCFATTLSEDYLQTQYWKYYTSYNAAWPSSTQPKGVAPLFWNDKCLGFKWRIRSMNQWKIIDSISYVTCAHFLQDKGEIVTDLGMTVTGNKWNVDDFTKRKNICTSKMIPIEKDEIDNEKEVPFSEKFDETQYIKQEQELSLTQSLQNVSQSQTNQTTSVGNIKYTIAKTRKKHNIVVISDTDDDDDSDNDNNNNNNIKSDDDVTLKTIKKENDCDGFLFDLDDNDCNKNTNNVQLNLFGEPESIFELDDNDCNINTNYVPQNICAQM